MEFQELYFSVHEYFRFRCRNTDIVLSFIDFDVRVDDEDKDNEVSDDSDGESLLSFIDDNVQTNYANFY